MKKTPKYNIMPPIVFIMPKRCAFLRIKQKALIAAWRKESPVKAIWMYAFLQTYLMHFSIAASTARAAIVMILTMQLLPEASSALRAKYSKIKRIAWQIAMIKEPSAIEAQWYL